MQLTSTLTCPACAHQSIEHMPADACRIFYECPSCGSVLRPKEGDCCVFCSFGDVPCPPVQEARAQGNRSCPCTQAGAGGGTITSTDEG